MLLLLLQSTTSYALWVVLLDGRGVPHVYPYGKFWIDGLEKNYTIHLQEYSGQLREGLTSEAPFTAKVN